MIDLSRHSRVTVFAALLQHAAEQNNITLSKVEAERSAENMLLKSNYYNIINYKVTVIDFIIGFNSVMLDLHVDLSNLMCFDSTPFETRYPLSSVESLVLNFEQAMPRAITAPQPPVTFFSRRDGAPLQPVAAPMLAALENTNQEILAIVVPSDIPATNTDVVAQAFVEESDTESDPESEVDLTVTETVSKPLAIRKSPLSWAFNRESSRSTALSGDEATEQELVDQNPVPSSDHECFIFGKPTL